MRLPRGATSFSAQPGGLDTLARLRGPGPGGALRKCEDLVRPRSLVLAAAQPLPGRPPGLSCAPGSSLAPGSSGTSGTTRLFTKAPNTARLSLYTGASVLS